MNQQTEVLDETCIDLRDLSDTGAAIGAARHLAAEAGFSETEQCLIATAVSELATNIIRYAGRGEVTVRAIRAAGREGVEVVALDAGPGIADLAQAMQENYSTGNSLGLGLPGVKRIMDEFTVDSKPGRGTRCVARKWRG